MFRCPTTRGCPRTRATSTVDVDRSLAQDSWKPVGMLVGTDADTVKVDCAFAQDSWKPVGLLGGTDAADLLPYNGVGWLGMGYDLFSGNPDGDKTGSGMGVDPGIRRPCVQITTYKQDNEYRTADNRFVQPVEGYAFEWQVCSMASSYASTSTTEGYQKSLEVDAEVHGGYEGFVASASFAASAGYKQFESKVGSAFASRYRSVSYCLKSEIGFHDGHQHEGTKDFQLACMALNKYEEAGLMAKEAAWFEFFRLWGTHFMGVVRLGGKMVHTLELDESRAEKKGGEEMNASIALEIESISASGGMSASIEKTQAAQTYLSEVTSSESIVVVGGLPATLDSNKPSEGFSAWAATVEEHPMPVQYKLFPLCLVGWNEQSKRGVLDPETYGKMLGKWKIFSLASANTRWEAEMVTGNSKNRLISSASPGVAPIRSSYLENGKFIASNNKEWMLKFEDNHLRIKKVSTGRQVWSTPSFRDQQMATAAFLEDGQLVIKARMPNESFRELYRLGQPGTAPTVSSYLVMEDDGSLKCYTKDNKLMWTLGWQTLLANGHQCGGAETNLGYVKTVAECGAKASAKGSKFFVYGTNDNGGSYCKAGQGCACYAEVPGYKTCSRKAHSGFNLYENGSGVETYTKVESDRECTGAATDLTPTGYVKTVAECAARAKAKKSTLFIYGKKPNRCNVEGCKCWTQVPGSGTCSTKWHGDYDLWTNPGLVALVTTAPEFIALSTTPPPPPTPPPYRLLAKARQCKGSYKGGEINLGYVEDVANCAAKASGKGSTFFAYGTNEYGASNCKAGQGCACYAEVPGYEECSQESHNGFDLYENRSWAPTYKLRHRGRQCKVTRGQPEINLGYEQTVENCATAARAKNSTFFTYGNNSRRCNSQGCLCFAQVPGYRSCDTEETSNYNLWENKW